VTGASGFVGSHIAEAAHEAGYEVHVLVRSTSPRRWLTHPWLTVHECGFFDKAALVRILRRMDAVIHAAGTLWGDYHKVNTLGTRTLAQASIEAGVRRFVYISSLAAAGPSRSPYSKDGAEPQGPISPYGYSKKAAEELLCRLADRLNVVILRYPMVYGPRDVQGLRLFKTFRAFLNPTIGLRPRHISMVYVKDAARAAVAALKRPSRSGAIYNISDGNDYTFTKLYRIVGEVWRRKALCIPVPFPLIMFGAWLVNDFLGGKTAFNPDQIGMFRKRYWLVSPERAMRELDWRPMVDVREGIRETISWYQKMGWL